MYKLTPLTWFIILAVVAIGLAIGLPPDPHAVRQLHTSATAYRLAIAVLLIPYILIWYASFYAFAKVQEYARLLKRTKDGVGFRWISIGLAVLAFSLVIPTIISLILSNIAAHHTSFQAAETIIDNYLGLFPGLAAFLIIYCGARRLLRTTRGGTKRIDVRWNAPWFLLMSVVFSHLAIDNTYRGHIYHLNLWLVIVTIIVPYLYAWMVGLLSAYDLSLYAKTVKGLIYQRAIKQFALGITVTMLGSIAIQFTDVTLSQRVDKSLIIVLLIDYVLLAILAVGLVLMALGTKKLKIIEEV